MKFPYALQLYSVRDYFEKDVSGSLARVKGAGYDRVELAGICGMTGEAFKKLLDASRLEVVSMHVGYDELVRDPQVVAGLAEVFGVSLAVVPWLGGDMCPNRDAWIAATRKMDDAGAVLKARGVQLCYHNHAHEFAACGGESIFDIIYANSAPEHLQLQLDTCWSTVAGIDTIALLNRYAGRVALVHVKDCKPFAPGSPPVFTELGRGVMDWNAVLPAAKEAGARWFIVEQDESEGDSMESARENAAFMAEFNR